MSSLNESLSGISDMDVVEGTTANQVQQSEYDKSISHSITHLLEVPAASPSKPGCKSVTQKKKELLEVPSKLCQTSISKRLLEESSYIVPEISVFDPNTFDYESLSKKMSKKPTESKESICIERLYSLKRSAEEKLEKERQKHLEEMSRECIFQPETHHKHEFRSFREYYSDSLKHQKLREDKIQELQLQREENCLDKFKFKPSICQKSQRIVQFKPYAMEPCHERLFQMYKSTSMKKSALNSMYMDEIAKDTEGDSQFIPEVNKKSKELVRSKPIDDLLYEDALRRREKNNQPTEMNTSGPSKKSINILVKSFLCEFDRQVKLIDLSNGINYSRFVLLFKAMSFLDGKNTDLSISMLIELWGKMQGFELTVNDLKVAMMGIMGYYQSWMKDCNSQTFTLTKAELPKFHEKYSLLFENRTTVQLHSSSYDAKEAKSKVSYRKQFKVEEAFVEKEKLRQRKLHEMKAEQQATELSACTFKPEVSYRSGKLAKASHNKRRMSNK